MISKRQRTGQGEKRKTSPYRGDEKRLTLRSKRFHSGKKVKVISDGSAVEAF